MSFLRHERRTEALRIAKQTEEEASASAAPLGWAAAMAPRFQSLSETAMTEEESTSTPPPEQQIEAILQRWGWDDNGSGMMTMSRRIQRGILDFLVYDGVVVHDGMREWIVAATADTDDAADEVQGIARGVTYVWEQMHADMRARAPRIPQSRPQDERSQGRSLAEKHQSSRSAQTTSQRPRSSVENGRVAAPYGR